MQPYSWLKLMLDYTGAYCLFVKQKRGRQERQEHERRGSEQNAKTHQPSRIVCICCIALVQWYSQLRWYDSTRLEPEPTEVKFIHPTASHAVISHPVVPQTPKMRSRSHKMMYLALTSSDLWHRKGRETSRTGWLVSNRLEQRVRQNGVSTYITEITGSRRSISQYAHYLSLRLKAELTASNLATLQPLFWLGFLERITSLTRLTQCVWFRVTAMKI